MRPTTIKQKGIMQFDIATRHPDRRSCKNPMANRHRKGRDWKLDPMDAVGILARNLTTRTTTREMKASHIKGLHERKSAI